MAKGSTDIAPPASELRRGHGSGKNGRPEASCGDFDIRIGRDGTWYYKGSPIGRPALVKLFASVLRRDGAGDYWLVTPVERGRLTVDDAPFVAVELGIEGAGRGQALSFRTNLDERVTADRDHPIRVAHDRATGAPSPYVLVRPGFEARILRAVYYQLVEFGAEEAVAGDHLFGVWSRGAFFPLGRLEESA